MQSKISSAWAFLIVSIVGIICSSIIIVVSAIDVPSPLAESQLSQGYHSEASEGLASSTVTGEQTIPGLPVRLKIPIIHVDAPVEYKGLTADGAMDVPKDPASAAWFDLGPRPGQKGSAVIAGHYGWKNDIPAVFDNVSTLRRGDKVYIEDEQGLVISFIVRELRTYGENEDASDVFISNDGKMHLNLITCEGIWSKEKKSYSNRLIVFTDLVAISSN